ncbi:MAG: hypothetical protein WBW69_18045 [Candidatus Korobacteraceae bacterium]
MQNARKDWCLLVFLAFFCLRAFGMVRYPSNVRRLFGEEPFPPRSGLYLLGELNVPWLVDQPFSAGALTADGRPIGILINVAPLRFALAAVPPADDSPLLASKSSYRPATITMANLPNGKILFKWDGTADRQDIVIGPTKEPGPSHAG